MPTTQHHNDRVLGHITSSVYHGGGSSTTSYTITQLPARPAHGSKVYEVGCNACSNTYRVRIASTAVRRLHQAVLFVLFPVLIFLSMAVPGLLGYPELWLLSFALSICCLVWYKRRYGVHGVGHPRVIKPITGERAKHRIFAAKKQ